jgi:urea transport system ATP-binding protein
MLIVNSLNLNYGASQALRGVNLSAKEGEVTCIVGKNGVGKTTLLNAIMGLERISAGEIFIGGHPISREPAYARSRRGLALVPQGRDIFSQLTVEENLRIGLSGLPRSEKKIPPDLFQYFPVLSDMLHRKGGDLSGGQQQQLAIARALAAKPRVLLLDEPTEGIQPSIIKLITSVIKSLRDRGNMAIILVEQYFEFAFELADKIIVMERGNVTLDGAKTDLDEQTIRKYLTV